MMDEGKNMSSGMNAFENDLFKKIGPGGMDRVQSTKVGIAGAGGLGSNCAMNLVRCGFKKFVIADFDKVEYSNLDRQFYFLSQVGDVKVEALKVNLMKINPTLEIETFHVMITSENIKNIFGSCAVVVEAFDGAENKKMLVEVFSGTEKFVVSASGICGIGGSDTVKTRKIGENLVIIGDQISDVGLVPPFSPRVNLAAAKQADAVLEYVLGRDRFVPIARALDAGGGDK